MDQDRSLAEMAQVQEDTTKWTICRASKNHTFKPRLNKHGQEETMCLYHRERKDASDKKHKEKKKKEDELKKRKILEEEEPPVEKKQKLEPETTVNPFTSKEDTTIHKPNAYTRKVSKKSICNGCGKTGHYERDCPDTTCDDCHGKGHWKGNPKCPKYDA